MITKYTQDHIGIFIGRFQPFHEGHLNIITNAMSDGLTKFKIFIGSANSSINTKNPFSTQDRCRMICDNLIEIDRKPLHIINNLPNRESYITDKVTSISILTLERNNKTFIFEIIPLNDYSYNDNKWIAELTDKIYKNNIGNIKPVLLGFDKDKSSYYLNLFKNMETRIEKYPTSDIFGNIIDATNLRERFFSKGIDENDTDLKNFYTTKPTYLFLKDYFNLRYEEWKYLHDEFKYITEYKKMWEGLPYPVIFNTVDALVVQDNHILLIKRKDCPGKNLWALPGGFINYDETMEDAMLRELTEETGIKLQIPVLRRCICDDKTFDSISRSSRGRTITRCYFIKLEPAAGLPKIKGSSDAKFAKWVPFHEVLKMKSNMFEDHWDMIDSFLHLK